MTGPQAETPGPPRAPAPRTNAARSPSPAPASPNRARPGWADYLRDPRSAVLSFLATALVLGGGRKALQALRARRIMAAIAGSDPAVADVEAAADHGRTALIDLFRLLGTAGRPEVRAAAGRTLARLWRADELIAEEEKAIVRRGFEATWRARRKYPRDLAVPIPMGVDFGVPFLVGGQRTVGPDHLAWSYRLLGTERAGLEEWAEAPAGKPSAAFAIFPGDFATLGPHRLVLQAKVRTVGLTDAWEFDLPHLPFLFEFDPHLTVAALLTLPDAARADRFAAAVRLGAPAEAAPPLGLTADLVLRDPPSVLVHPPLPCDLAHRLAVEVEGVAGSFAAGSVVAVAADLAGDRPAAFPLGPIEGFPLDAIDRPGPRRVRAILTADANLGWADPAVRSVWPTPIATDWVDVRVIRR